MAHASFRRQLLMFYKHFYKLRNLVGRGNAISTNKYQNILRRSFRNVSFFTRREILLKGETTSELTEDDMSKRLSNTLVFIFNATVKKTDEFDNDEILFYEDIQRTNTDTTESKILSTILEMEYQKPDEIKYDFNYEWIGKLNKELLRYDEFMERSKTGKGFKSKVPMNYIGFKQYETTLMRFNEYHNLCL
ncbi:uncharacterized protein CANTADRAFT_54913 [Suhomyces tanzawaensis NRRL Y-17324]|uniref:DUF1763-domain-containing protein n=1 Tax=Suhomyces tanzawaensis NRRL Y-17324 TaxID=984487 RepID=A0A1E4SF62_9ASCO|nr:uncharacterized protein CANTADRAFT_54913 [Suhomyces tanzawaensis NRRL Y-17324]ODV78116.1 hypothetical protein CANTADRAFT_54913 [Suhomyces tanzawaensis NRRL Y-17324]